MVVTPANQDRFLAACEAVGQSVRQAAGIGCLTEKSLHAVVKAYVAHELSLAGQHPVRLEAPVGGFVADIAGEKGIVEVQTQQWHRLRRKLEVFLSLLPVTVVYPVARVRWIVCVDEETGEVVRRRKSPKQGRVYDLLPELYAIRPFLHNPRLRFCLLLLEVEEYRLLTKEKRRRWQKGYIRQDVRPLSLHDAYEIADRDAYGLFVPDGLPKAFTSQDYQKQTGLAGRRLHGALQVLQTVGVIQKTGKSGRFILYEKTSPDQKE